MLFVSLILQSDEMETLAKDFPEPPLVLSALGSQPKARALSSPPAAGIMTSVRGGDANATRKALSFSVCTTDEA